MIRTRVRSIVSAWMAFAGLGIVAPVVAQEGAITGTVTNANTGQPIAGVRILLDGTNQSVVTDQEGRYTLRAVADGQATVRAIAIGFQAMRTVLTVMGGQGTADFRLTPAVVSLDEIVVTATGEQRKRELANAVANIDASSVVEESMPQSVASLIQGRAAGVQVINSSGSVGSGTKIRIRGSSSVSLSNEPLLVVDGIRVDNRQDDQSIGFGGQTISRLNDFNPDEIESIEIVKGPSAAALYGTQAANGVIVITTKRGQAGQTQWRVYTEQGIGQEAAQYPDNFRGIDAGAAPLGDGRPGSCRVQNQAAGSCTQTGLEVANPLMSDITRPFRTGHRQQYGLNVQGGSETVQYFLSGEFERDDGVWGLPAGTVDSITELEQEIPGFAQTPNLVERANFRGNISSQIGNKTNVRVSLGYTSADIRLPQNDNNINGIIPSGVLGSTDSTSRGGWGFFAPEEVFFRQGQQAIDRFTGSAAASFRPTSWLELRGTGGVDFTARGDVLFQATGTGPDFGIQRLGDRTSDKTSTYSYTLDLGATAQYDLTSQVSGKTSGGFQYFRNNREQVLTEGNILTGGGGSQKVAIRQFINENFVESITVGGFVEQQFGYNDRLFVTAAVRADDNSAFGQDFNLVYYPKFGASWTVTESGFGPMDDLRVRAAWGASGQQPAGNTALRFFNATSVADVGTDVPGIEVGGAGNPNLKPERSEEIEAGIDASLFDGRVGLEATYYRRRTTDALIARQLAPSLGQTATRTENIGETLNWGWEGAISATVIDGNDLAWDLTVSGSTNSNRLVELGEGVEPIIFGAQRHVEDFPLGGFWQERFAFEDTDGDGVLDVSEVTTEDTVSFLGYSRPRYEISLSSAFDFKRRFRLSGLFDYRGGHRQYNFTEAFRCRFFICEGLNNVDAPLEEQARAFTQVFTPAQTGTGFIEPGWFIKLRELSLSFIAPDRWARALGASRWTITVTGRNLFSIDDYTGPDPEVQGNTGNFGSQDFLTQAQIRTFTARFDLTF